MEKRFNGFIITPKGGAGQVRINLTAESMLSSYEPYAYAWGDNYWGQFYDLSGNRLDFVKFDRQTLIAIESGRRPAKLYLVDGNADYHVQCLSIVKPWRKPGYEAKVVPVKWDD